MLQGMRIAPVDWASTSEAYANITRRLDASSNPAALQAEMAWAFPQVSSANRWAEMAGMGKVDDQWLLQFRDEEGRIDLGRTETELMFKEWRNRRAAQYGGQFTTTRPQDAYGYFEDGQPYRLRTGQQEVSGGTYKDTAIQGAIDRGQNYFAQLLMGSPDMAPLSGYTARRWGMETGTVLGRLEQAQTELLQPDTTWGVMGEDFQNTVLGFMAGTGKEGLDYFSNPTAGSKRRTRFYSAAAELTSRGIDINSLATSRFAAETGGLTPSDAQLAQMRLQVAKEMQADDFSADTMELQGKTLDKLAGINYMRRQYGMDTRQWTTSLGETLLDPLGEAALSTFTGVSGNISFRRTGSEFLLQSGAARRAESLAGIDPAESMRLSQNIEMAAGYADQARAQGFQISARNQIGLNMYAGLSEADRLQADAAMSGDRMWWSNNWQSLIGKPLSLGMGGVSGLRGRGVNRLQGQGVMTAADAVRFQTIDTTTGLGAFETGISTAEESWIREDASVMGRGDWIINRSSPDYDAFQGGYRGMQTRIRDLQVGQRQREHDYQIWQRDTGWQQTIGGATGLSAQGFATGGDGLQALSRLLSPVLGQMGMTFNAGNGMGMWQLQDAQVAMGREQQMFSWQQQGQSLQLNWAEFGMQGRRFEEQQARNLRRAEWSEDFQARQMGRGREQALTQLDWAEEDLAFNRNKSQLQFGWQMEDMDEQIRFARGRQRRLLMRQRDRAVISQSMQEGRFDVEEGRLDKRREWEDEQFKLQEEHFKKSIEWRKEDMEVTRRYFNEDRRLQEQRLRMSEEAHRRQLAWMQQGWQIEDQRRLLERQVQMAMYQEQVNIQNASWETEQRVRVLNETMSSMGTTMDTTNAKLNLMATNLSLLNTYLASTIQTIGDAVPASSSSSGVGGGLAGLGGRGFAEGGYTGDGAPWAVAGVVHKGEHVVPQGGALVLRGGETDALLREIRDILRAMNTKGLAKLTFNYGGRDFNAQMKYAQDLLDYTYQEVN